MDTDLITYWNVSGAKVPKDKMSSGYAREKERLFPRGAMVVDLGGGSGVDSFYFVEHGHEISLLDISDQQLAVAEEKAEKEGKKDKLHTWQVNFEQETLPLDDGCAQVVYSRLALHYFNRETTEKLLMEIYRILASKGQAFLTVKSPADVEELAYLQRTAEEIEPGVFVEKGRLKTRFSKEAWREMLQAAGIKETEFVIRDYTENFVGKNDVVKSGNAEMLLIEIEILKE